MESLVPSGKDIVMGGGRYPGAENVLSIGGVISSVVWIVVVGHVRGNDKDGLGNPCNLPKADHG